MMNIKSLVYPTIFSVLACLFISVSVYSQQTIKTPEELEAMIKGLQKKADSMQKAMKINKKPGSDPNRTTSTAVKKSNEPENIKLPPRDSVRISSIPRKRFNLPELKTYLTDLYDQMCRRFPADAVSSAKSIASKLANNPAKLESAALMAWENGADEEAVLLITKGASVSGNDGLVLVNAGAILDMYGLSEKAIPVLRTIVAYSPNNALANNNLGQAFTSLGMQDSAMFYLGRCISSSPQHPEANNTAGFIELKRGNKTKAQSYFENSLRGGFNISAYTGLKQVLKEKTRIANLIKPKVKFPEYFNQFKYKLPRHCLNVNEAATVRQEFDNYKKMLNSEIRKYDLLRKDAEKSMGKNWAEEANKRTMEMVMQGKNYMKPFQVLGSAMEAEAMLGYHDDLADLENFNKQNREQYKALEKEYNQAHEALMNSSGSTCAKENELKNRYLPLFAQLNEEFQSRNMLIENKYIDDLMYWCYFSAFDINDYRHRFNNIVYNYLYKINWLAQVKILDACEEKEVGETEKPVPPELSEYDCPDLKIPFIIGKLTFNCEKFSFKAGELIVFKYEKKFTGKRQSTISIGAGGGVDASVGAGPISAGFEAGMDMSFYLTFDKSGNCTDAGMAYSASRSASLDFSAGERINLSKNLANTGESFGWRFGINSGVSFDTPDIPWLKEKTETPINKNVQIYQQNR